MRKILFTGLFVCILIGAAGAGWYWWEVSRFIEKTDDAYLASDITAISPRIAGYVAAVAVQDNQSVKPGDVLVRLDDSDFRAKVAEAQANLDARRAAINNLASRLQWQQSAIAQARAEINSVQAEATRAIEDRDRVRSLVKSDYVSRSRSDIAEADAHKALAALNKAKAKLDSEEQQTKVLESERGQLAAAARQAEANLALAEIDLANTMVRSPVGGTVGNRGVQVGEYVRAGTLLMSVVPLDRVWIQANFKETQLAHMHHGQPVRISIDAYPDLNLAGTVDSLAPASGAKFSLLPPENATGNFTKVVQRIPVKILLPPDHALAGRLRPGLSVVVSVDTRHPGDGQIIGPAAAAERQ